MSLPSLSISRTTLQSSSLSSTTYSLTIPLHQTQIRTATLLRRPKRPYTFTQLVTLSDGSTFVHRTTSPLPIYQSTRDTRNVPLWNPSSVKITSQEEDEAGRLASFRARYGRGFDASVTAAAPGGDKTQVVDAMTDAKIVEGQPRGETEAVGEDGFDEEDENLLDLITGFGQQDSMPGSEKDVVRARKKQSSK